MAGWSRFVDPWRSWRAMWALARFLPSETIKEIYRADPTKFSVDDYACITRMLTLGEFIHFAYVTGDWNPIHWDEDHAASSPFGDNIAHGMLVGSLFSAVFGMLLPGPGAIYLEQTLKFRAPVKRGNTVVAKVVLVELLPKNGARFSCIATVGEETVIEGEAVLKLPK